MTEFTLGLTQGFSHGRAFSELTTPSSPAAGTALTIQLGGKYWERPIALAFTLSAGADDAVTDVTVEYQDGSGVPVAGVAAGAGVALSTSAFYSFVFNWNTVSSWSSNVLTGGLPPLFLQPTWKIVVQPVGTWTEGQITAVRYYAERFQTGSGGYLQGHVDDVTSRALLADQMRAVLEA